MALSLREKSTISRRIKENAAKLSAGGLSLREKSTVSRAIKEDVALLIGDTLPVQATELPNDSTPRHWQIDENRLSDPSGGSEVIEAWDLAKADALLESAMVADPNIPPVPLARQFIESHLQGRIVKTAEGDCIINSGSKGELSLAANRYGKVKLHCIPRIPEILINGESLGLEKLKKERRDKIIGFYPFRHIVEFKDGLKADVELRVGKREGDGLPLVYSMDAKWLTLDSVVAQKNGTSFIRYPVGQTNTHSVYRSTIDVIMDASDSTVNNDDDDSMNIRIIAVWDKDGNRLPEFEDDANHGLDHSTLLVPQPLSAIDTDPDLETFTAEDLIPDGPDELSSADYLRQMASKAPTRQSFFNLVVMKVNGASKEDRQQIQELFGLEHPPKGLAELRAASDKFYDSQKGQRKQRRENYKAALAQSKQRQNEQFLAGISDTARDSNAAMNAHIESVNKFYREKGIDHALPFDMAAKQYDYADWKQSQAAQNPDLETFTETDLIPDGDDNTVKTAKGTKVSTGFAVIEANKLIVSHDNQGNENPEYPYELQPRDRKRAESVAWVLKTAKNLDVDSLGKTRSADSGAPIVGKDRVVESGNGRTMAIIEAYRISEAEEYRDWLIDEAKSFGLNPDKINTMKKPVLVRVRKSKLDRVAFATEANQDDKLAMTATEKAKADAHRLTPDLISKLKDGDLSSASNRDFILGFLQSLGDTEAAQYSTTDGKPTKQIFDRVQAALFAHAYNDDRLLQLMADDAKPEIKNIISALNAASPEFIKAKGINESAHSKTIAQLTDSVEVSLDQEAVDTIINATNVIMDAKNKGLSIEDLLSQEDMFGSNITPEIAAMALFIRDNNKSSARLAMAFQEMASFIKSDLQSRQTSSLFGDDEPVTLVDVLRVANDKLKQSYGDNVKTIGGENLGGFIDLFTETMGQNAAREAYLAEQAPQTETDPNVALLQDIAKGQYSHLDSEALLDKAEPAARAVDVASYSELVGEAMGEWLNVDNKAYALDSVLDTRNIIGWFEN